MKEDDLRTYWQLVGEPLTELLVELIGLGWGIVGDTSAVSPETEVEAEEAEGPLGLSLEDDHLFKTLVQSSE